MSTKFWLYVLAACMAVLLGVSVATAQVIGGYGYGCGARQSMADTLINTYGENQIGVGIGKDQLLYEFWANEETGTWTILKTYTNGRACVAVVGDDFVPIGPSVPGEDS